MTTRSVLALTAAALLLGACGAEPTPVAETASSTATSSPVASSPASQPARGDKPDRAFVVGKWGTDGDCGMAIDLRPDGTSDGPFGNWSYTDGKITFDDAPDLEVLVTVVDPDTMLSANGSGKTTRMTRCR